MSNRALLHLGKIDEFAAWAATRGWERVPTVAPYEVLRLAPAVPRPGVGPLIFYRRATAKEHASTASNRGERLVRDYIAERHRFPEQVRQLAQNAATKAEEPG